MVKRMLVDTNHPEETRVVVIDGTRLEAFDLETSTKQQNKGNIYLAKVVRVEPSLQAAFVDYGGNRHGFLAFSEIHPDYYQIPVADREALLEEAKAHEESLAEDDDSDAPPEAAGKKRSNDETPPGGDSPAEQQGTRPASPLASAIEYETVSETSAKEVNASNDVEEDSLSESSLDAQEAAPESNGDDSSPQDFSAGQTPSTEQDLVPESDIGKPGVEEVGGEDETEENLGSHRRKFVASRRYKIQEVIKRKQILLIQV